MAQRHGGHAEAQLLPPAAQLQHVATAAVAEAEIRPGEDVLDPDMTGEDLLREVFGLHAGKLEVELQLQHHVRLPRGFQQRSALVDPPGQQEGLGFRPGEVAARVRGKGQNARPAAQLIRPLARSPQQGLMPEVDTVKIADGKNHVTVGAFPPAKGFKRNGRDPFHGACEASIFSASVSISRTK